MRIMYDPFGELMSMLTDEELVEAEKEASDLFFSRYYPDLKGNYCVENLSLVIGENSEDVLREDAAKIGIDPDAYVDVWRDMLIDTLEESFDNLLYDVLCRMVERKAR